MDNGPCCRQFGSDECECLDGCDCGCMECYCDPDEDPER